jgi:Lon protease-like protein
MKLRGDLPDKIPLFPLPGALLLPRAMLPLQIFEPRYLAMLDETLKTSHRLIGMIQPRPVPSGEDELSSIGCAGRVTGFSETDDGRYRITLTGISRFRLQREVSGLPPLSAARSAGTALNVIADQPKRIPDFTERNSWACSSGILPPATCRPTGKACKVLTMNC